ncbi:MAG TPA: haloacid dehalogenase-like hydrolase, partial [Nitrospirales bacterium]|nr:haloacid dehalogenase-like hydrolase [Nitrospirales bacterium]
MSEHSRNHQITRSPNHQILLPWAEIDDVLLDMDGTLLDRHFDNFFFEEELPRRYAAMHKLSFEDARDRLMALYRSRERELDWTDLGYWTRTLGIDLVALTNEFRHMIMFHPDAEPFLRTLRAHGKRAHLVTNAHTSGLAIKLQKTGVERYLDRVINAFDVGC